MTTPRSYDERLKLLPEDEEEGYVRTTTHAEEPPSLWGRGRVRSAGDLDVIASRVLAMEDIPMITKSSKTKLAHGGKLIAEESQAAEARMHTPKTKKKKPKSVKGKKKVKKDKEKVRRKKSKEKLRISNSSGELEGDPLVCENKASEDEEGRLTQFEESAQEKDTAEQDSCSPVSSTDGIPIPRDENSSDEELPSPIRKPLMASGSPSVGSSKAMKWLGMNGGSDSESPSPSPIPKRKNSRKSHITPEKRRDRNSKENPGKDRRLSWHMRSLTSTGKGKSMLKSTSVLPNVAPASPSIEAKFQGRRRGGSDSMDLISRTTVDMLIDSLFSELYLSVDPHYIDHFLQLYKVFMTPKRLLETLIDMYSKEVPLGLPVLELAKCEAEGAETRKKIVLIIARWMEVNEEDFKDNPELLDKVNYFLHNVVTSDDKEYTPITSVYSELLPSKSSPLTPIEDKVKKFEALLWSAHDNSPENSPSKMVRLDFMELSVKDIVEELTAINVSLFIAIKPWEFLNVLWSSGSEDNSQLEDLRKWNQQNEQTEGWVFSEILRRHNLKQRILTLAKFIEIAKIAHRTGNLHSAFTIMNALMSSMVLRLKNTWENLPKRSISDYEKLLDLLRPHYASYNEFIESLYCEKSEFLLPSINIFIKEIEKLKDCVGPKVNDVPDWVDFGRLRKAIEIVAEIQNFQQELETAPYVSRKPLLMQYLKHPKVVPKNVLNFFSLHCESMEDGKQGEVTIDNFDTGIVYGITKGKFVVKYGTKERLVDKLMDVWLNDLNPDYREAFLLNRSSFITPIELFTQLTQIYTANTRPAASLPAEDLAKRKIVMDVFKCWMNLEFTQLKEDKEFVAMYLEFSSSTIFGGSEETSFWLKWRDFLCPNRRSLGQSELPAPIHTHESKTSARVIASTYEGPKWPRDKFYTKNFPKDAAVCITLIDQEYLEAIKITELVRKAYTDPKRSPNVAAMITRFNALSGWVATWLVAEPETARRAAMMTQFIKLAGELRKLNNFHSANAVIAGLNFSAISRLKITWAQLPGKALYKKETLEELFHFGRNFRNYRKTVKKSKPPLMPFLGQYSKNLFAIEENNSVYREDKTVNFERFEMLIGQIRNLQLYQQNTFHLDIPDPALLQFLQSVDKEGVDEETIYHLSLEREPKPFDSGSFSDSSPVGSPIPSALSPKGKDSSPTHNLPSQSHHTSSSSQQANANNHNSSPQTQKSESSSPSLSPSASNYLARRRSTLKKKDSKMKLSMSFSDSDLATLALAAEANAPTSSESSSSSSSSSSGIPTLKRKISLRQKKGVPLHAPTTTTGSNAAPSGSSLSSSNEATVTRINPLLALNTNTRKGSKEEK